MKIPRDAFEYYMGLGNERSYETVARHYGATKRAVVMRATKEKWQELASERDRTNREATAKKALETSGATRERQLKVARTVQVKALEALRAMPIESAIDAIRALDMSLRQERAILGDPTAVNADSLETIIRAQYDRWRKPEVSDEGGAR